MSRLICVPHRRAHFRQEEPLSCMLAPKAYTGNGGRTENGNQQGLTIVIAAAGEINVSRVGGNVDVMQSNDSTPVAAALGEDITIGKGGYMIPEAGSAWALEGNGSAPSVGIWFSIDTKSDDATPQSNEATPSASEHTIVLKGKPVNCAITPLTSDDINRVMSTPVAITNPLERSLKNQEGGYADDATTDAITQLLQGYVDCSASGNYSQMYAYYSDQAIRDSETIRNLVERRWQVGDGPGRASVEDIILFDDGHAGARTVIDGEAAYLTFVKQNGEWKIDVWDDSGSGTDATATPQA